MPVWLRDVPLVVKPLIVADIGNTLSRPGALNAGAPPPLHG
jgi:hypothetical protein